VPVTNVIKTKHILLWKTGIFLRSFLMLTDMKRLRTGCNQNLLLLFTGMVLEPIIVPDKYIR